MVVKQWSANVIWLMIPANYILRFMQPSLSLESLFAEISENDSEVDLNYDPSDFSYQYDIDEEVLAEIEEHTNEKELNLIQTLNKIIISR